MGKFLHGLSVKPIDDLALSFEVNRTVGTGVPAAKEVIAKQAQDCCNRGRCAD